MRVGLLTREWPPDVYGGAGVHVEFLARELRRLVDVEVHCFGGPRVDAVGHDSWAALAGANSTLAVISTDLSIAAAVGECDLLHTHTWYANLAGHIGGLLYDVPHVMTSHSLEPLRPWKAEQLGGGFALSSWAERTAVHAAAAIIAVSEGMRQDVVKAYPEIDPAKVHVVHNGIDPAQFAPHPDADAVRSLGVDPDRPYVLFVGRITRQKGLPHLLRAAHHLSPDVQLVLCASSADTPEIRTEVAGAVADLQATRHGVVWIDTVVPRRQLVALLTLATVFVCPSVYEPLGIVNLEAMACETAVVATATGGIPEVVADGETGLLVPIEQAQDGSGTPLDPDRFARDLAERIDVLVSDPARAAAMGRAGRERAVRQFGWDAVAARTVEVYRSVL